MRACVIAPAAASAAAAAAAATPEPSPAVKVERDNPVRAGGGRTTGAATVDASGSSPGRWDASLVQALWQRTQTLVATLKRQHPQLQASLAGVRCLAVCVLAALPLVASPSLRRRNFPSQTTFHACPLPQHWSRASQRPRPRRRTTWRQGESALRGGAFDLVPCRLHPSRRHHQHGPHLARPVHPSKVERHPARTSRSAWRSCASASMTSFLRRSSWCATQRMRGPPFSLWCVWVVI